MMLADDALSAYFSPPFRADDDVSALDGPTHGSAGVITPAFIKRRPSFDKRFIKWAKLVDYLRRAYAQAGLLIIGRLCTAEMLREII